MTAQPTSDLSVGWFGRSVIAGAVIGCGLTAIVAVFVITGMIQDSWFWGAIAPVLAAVIILTVGLAVGAVVGLLGALAMAIPPLRRWWVWGGVVGLLFGLLSAAVSGFPWIGTPVPLGVAVTVGVLAVACGVGAVVGRRVVFDDLSSGTSSVMPLRLESRD